MKSSSDLLNKEIKTTNEWLSKDISAVSKNIEALSKDVQKLSDLYSATTPTKKIKKKKKVKV